RRYLQTERIWPFIEWIPPKLQSNIASLLMSGCSRTRRMTSRGPLARLTNRVLNFSDMLPARHAAEFYYALSSPCRKPDEWLSECHNPAVPSWPESFPRLLDQMMYSDAAMYLPDDILVKV